MTENQLKFLQLDDSDFYEMHTRTLRIVNAVSREFGLPPIKRCLDCLRKRYFELQELLQTE